MNNRPGSTDTTPGRSTPTDSARRTFLKGTTAALAGGLLVGRGAGDLGVEAATGMVDARPLTEKEKLARIATNTYPHRTLFKQRARAGGMAGGANAAAAQERAAAMKKKYGELTLLDYPQWTRDNFVGVWHMDLWSSLFGDVTDDSMYAQTQVTMGDGQSRPVFEFDPSLPSARTWLDRLANNSAKTGVLVHHVSNNAPRNISVLDAAERREGIAVAKRWLDGCAQ